jgi:hypothetical protein
MAQVVGCLPSKPEILNLNPNTDPPKISHDLKKLIHTIQNTFLKVYAHTSIEIIGYISKY